MLTKLRTLIADLWWGDDEEPSQRETVEDRLESLLATEDEDRCPCPDCSGVLVRAPTVH